MSDRHPRISIVNVKVIDLSKYMKEALDFFLKSLEPNAKKPVALRSVGKWAICETQKGTFALCAAGVGPDKPITASDKLVLDLWADYEGGALSLFPVLQIGLNIKDLKSCPVVETVKLSDFIQRFGNRLEDNFDIWNQTLTFAHPVKV